MLFPQGLHCEPPKPPCVPKNSVGFFLVVVRPLVVGTFFVSRLLRQKSRLFVSRRRLFCLFVVEAFWSSEGHMLCFFFPEGQRRESKIRFVGGGGHLRCVISTGNRRTGPMAAATNRSGSPYAVRGSSLQPPEDIPRVVTGCDGTHQKRRRRRAGVGITRITGSRGSRDHGSLWVELYSFGFSLSSSVAFSIK